MLKRNDLVEQFSLVVKQEIKNHQDVRVATNTAINLLNEQIDSLSARFSLQINEILQTLQIQDVRQNRLEDVFVENRDKVASIVHDMQGSCKKMMVSCESLDYKNKELQKIVEECDKKLDIAFQLDIEKADQIEDVSQHINNEINRLNATILEIAKKTKKEILDIPSELGQMKEYLDDKIESYRIDSSGIIRELAVFKKTLYIAGKEIENLNVQIERLKNMEK